MRHISILFLPLLVLSCAGIGQSAREAVPPPEKSVKETPILKAEPAPSIPEIPGLPHGSIASKPGISASLNLPDSPPTASYELSPTAVSGARSDQASGDRTPAMAVPDAPPVGKSPEPEEDIPRSSSRTEGVAVGYGPAPGSRSWDAPEAPAASEPARTADPRLSVPLAAISEKPVSRAIETPASAVPSSKTAPAEEKTASVPPKQSEAQTATATPAPKPTLPAAKSPAVATAGREQIARLGDEVQVALDGPSFLFLGYADRAKGEEGFALKSREIRDQRTLFTFKAIRLGTFDLSFSQQDNSAGISRQEAVRVRVLDNGGYAQSAASLAAPREDGGGKSVETAVRENADRLFDLGKNAAALAEYLKVIREDDAPLNDRIAGLYARLGDPVTAVAYWRKNLAAAPSYREAALYGIEAAALARQDGDLLLAYMKPFLDLKSRDIGDLLIGMARFLERTGDAAVSQDLLQQYLRRYPGGALLDEAYFLLGMIYEGTTALRDIRKSRDSYQTVVQKYPESALVLKARERVRYIDQHYLYVR